MEAEQLAKQKILEGFSLIKNGTKTIAHKINNSEDIIKLIEDIEKVFKEEVM